MLSGQLEAFQEEKRRKSTSKACILPSRDHKEEPRKGHGRIVIELGKHMKAWKGIPLLLIHTENFGNSAAIYSLRFSILGV